jgi:hypothetical protein
MYSSTCLRDIPSPPISIRPAGVVHRRVRLRQRLGSVLVLERRPRGLEARLRVVDRRGLAERRAGNGCHGDILQPDRRCALAGEPDAADGLAVLKHEVVVWGR